MKFKKLFKSSFFSIISVGINFLITVLVIRFWGSHTYTNYIIDLAVISLVSLILEIIPANYSVYKVQDDTSWLNIVFSQILLSVFLGFLILLGLQYFFGIFNDFTIWILFYILVLGFKKYQDIYLQSSGRISEFFKQESLISIFRLVIILGLYYKGRQGNQSVWFSLVIGSFLPQLFWAIVNKEHHLIFRNSLNVGNYAQMYKNKKLYYPYYVGIGLKRMKDNIVPILSQWFISTTEALAMFFLAFRSISFAVGQIRIIEAFLVKREVVLDINKVSLRTKMIFSFFIQLIAIITSFLLIFLSGEKNIQYEEASYTILLLSFLVIPIIFNILNRVNLYSKYKPIVVNLGYLIYVLSTIVLLSVAYLLELRYILIFVLVILFSETFQSVYLTKRVLKNSND